MAQVDAQVWQTFAEAYAFVGNSLLTPLTQTPHVGIDQAFWQEFPDFDDAQVAHAIETCAAYARTAAVLPEDEAVQRAAVEHTHLFIGPPSPAVPPWETMHRNGGTSVGFGEATFAMRALLREAGLELCNENRQYEDHLGIELLLLSELCRRQAEALEGGANASDAAEGAAKVLAYLEERPRSWAATFHERVAAERPGGYYDGLTALASALLDAQARLLS